MKKIRLLCSICAICAISSMSFADSGLIEGASFIDRFLPIEPQNLSNKSWGADNVQPRDIANGLEDKEFSYWGGNIIKGDDGKYHMFVARWPENIKKGNGKSGHHLWWDSDVAHAIADKPIGPYKVKEVIGKGHNPEIYKAKDGTYYIGVMGEKAYKAKSLNGPWEKIESKFDFYKKAQNKTNRTYIVDKKTGDIFMMNKEGWIFTSKGNEEFVEIPITTPAYTRRNGSHEEDPVIWKDEIQYNLIVNDCTHRTAYHLTSQDGKKWDYEDGIAYTPHILKHKNGHIEKWDKLERPKVFTDKYGRALYMNFAAIDSEKSDDLANDNHSSKNIVVPMRVPARMTLVAPKKFGYDYDDIQIKILAEDGFNPQKDINVKTLKFGDSKLVNYGQGSKAISSKNDGKDLIVTFKNDAHGLNRDDYKAKIIGKKSNGEPFFGYIKLR